MADRSIFVVKLNYELDLRKARQMIGGAQELSLQLEINTKNMEAQNGLAFALSRSVQEKMDLDDMRIFVQFPEDVEAIHDAQLKKEGNQIRGTLGKAMREIVNMHKSGVQVPAETIKRLK